MLTCMVNWIPLWFLWLQTYSHPYLHLYNTLVDAQTVQSMASVFCFRAYLLPNNNKSYMHISALIEGEMNSIIYFVNEI